MSPAPSSTSSPSGSVPATAADVAVSPALAAPTPIPISPRTRTILIFAGVAALIALIYLAPIVPRLAILGAALALVLSYPVALLQRVLSRRMAILVVVAGLLVLIGIALLVAVPVLVFQLTELVTNAPKYVDQLQDVSFRSLSWLRERGAPLAEPEAVIQSTQQEIVAHAQEVAQRTLGSILDAATQTVSALITIFGVIFVAVYLLADVGRFQAGFIRLAPAAYRTDAAALWDMLSTSLNRYIGGILISITAQGLAAMIAMYAIDVRYAALLGLWMAITALLPYIGAYLGAVPAVILAFLDSPLKALLTVGIYIAINQLESNFLTPRIQGHAVRVHPLMIFFAVLAGSEIGGLVGAVIAIPMLAVLRVLIEFFAHRLYVPGPPTPAPGRTVATMAGASTAAPPVAGAGEQPPAPM